MKKFSFNGACKFLLMFLFSCIQLFVWGQDNTPTTTTTTTKTTTSFQIEPWMWVVGGAVLLIILVALLRGSSSKDVSRTTVIKNERI